MVQFGDDLYLGNFFAAQGLDLFPTGLNNPTSQIGAGPMGRIAFYNIVPLALGAATLIASHAVVSGVALPLHAGTGITLGTAPDGSGVPVYIFDVPRCVSIADVTTDMGAITFTITGYDTYGRKQTDALAGPHDNTVTSLKAFKSIVSVIPNGASSTHVTGGTTDIFGLPFAITDAVYLVCVNWAETYVQDAGTFVAAVTTSPATPATGDTRGTYLPSSAADGTKRLLIGMHLTAAQCGSNPTITALIGVTPV